MGTPNLPVAAPDPADEIRERVDAAETDGWYGYDAEARADVRWLLVERQQDKERIEALTTATEGLLDVGERSRRGDPSLDPEEWYAIRDCARKLLEPAALAVEEDATRLTPEEAMDAEIERLRAAVEEDAHGD